jgi:Asp-tRNA(Asn)/Glu-tRNA(Gln) amidotransferase A subunit family amidase
VRRGRLVAGAALAGAVAGAPAAAQAPPRPPAAPTTPAPFRFEETTIAAVHAALRAGTLTCRDLVAAYLRRIEAYDRNGPAVNALVLVNPAVRTLDAIVQLRRFHPSIQPRLEYGQRVAVAPDQSRGCAAAERRRAAVRAEVARAMDRLRLDALVHPTWSNPPRLIGDLNTPAGDNSQLFAPLTGSPAVQVPMGYTRGELPAGLTRFGRAWSEPTLFQLAYAYEQATRHRRPPASAPPLR